MKPAAALVTLMPVVRTSMGRRPSAALTRFCTSTAARSMSRETSKVTVMALEPSLPEVEVMYFMPSTPLICCSMGVVTEVSTACAFAPV